jgi:putative methionine-R-sulfoxide reductase with GAF domain
MISSKFGKKRRGVNVAGLDAIIVGISPDCCGKIVRIVSAPKLGEWTQGKSSAWSPRIATAQDLPAGDSPAKGVAMKSNELADRHARVPDAIAAQRMRIVIDAIWMEFGSHRPVSWAGFYLMGSGEMTLGPSRDKPAYSPIGLHGACGAVAISGRSVVVRDVRGLGDAYIACDPRDLSEIVIPIRTDDGRITGVPDLDSHTADAFGEDDRIALERIAAAHLAD